MRDTTFNFESVKKVNAKRKDLQSHGFSVSLRHKYIYFPLSYVEDNNLEGKMIKWFVDRDKKALGWKILSEQKELLCDLAGYISIKRHKNRFLFSIGRILSLLNLKDTTSTFKNLKVNSHTDHTNSVYNGIIHYVLLTTPFKNKKE